MSKKITLEENINKLQNCLNAVKTLSNILDRNKSQNSVEKFNRTYLRKTLRNIRRLNNVIQTQISQTVPYVHIPKSFNDPVINMINLIRDNKIDQFTVKRDESFKNKVEIFEGDKYCGRFLIK